MQGRAQAEYLVVENRRRRRKKIKNSLGRRRRMIRIITFSHLLLERLLLVLASRHHHHHIYGSNTKGCTSFCVGANVSEWRSTLLGSNPRPRVASSRAHNIGPGLIFALAPPKPLNTRPRKEKNLQKIVFEAMGKEKKKNGNGRQEQQRGHKSLGTKYSFEWGRCVDERNPRKEKNLKGNLSNRRQKTKKKNIKGVMEAISGVLRALTMKLLYTWATAAALLTPGSYFYIF